MLYIYRKMVIANKLLIAIRKFLPFGPDVSDVNNRHNKEVLFSLNS